MPDRFGKAAAASLVFLAVLEIGALVRLSGGTACITQPKDIGHPPFVSFLSCGPMNGLKGMFNVAFVNFALGAYGAPYRGWTTIVLMTPHRLCRVSCRSLSRRCRNQHFPEGVQSQGVDKRLDTWPPLLLELLGEALGAGLDGPRTADCRNASWTPDWSSAKLSLQQAASSHAHSL